VTPIWRCTSAGSTRRWMSITRGRRTTRTCSTRKANHRDTEKTPERAMKWLFSICLAFSVSLCLWGSTQPQKGPRRFVSQGTNNKLVYDTDVRGNRIPDFSHAGYQGGGVPIPDAPVRVVVTPGKGDNTARIQAAIDYVAGLPTDAQGLRGAVL